MADFTDRIKLVFDAVTGDATRDMGKLKSATDEAQTGWGKLKGAAGDAIGKIAQSPAAMAAAGAAVAKVAFDLASGFGEAALSAQDFATASGLSVEEASRWQEVAGDVGVSTETLEGAVNKLNIAASKGALEELGIGGDTTNERLLNALTHLRGIDDASQRAQEGAKLFGKSWAALAPLVEESGDLAANLAAVSDAKVIDEEEVRKARELRDAMDRLNDTLDDVKLIVGEQLIGPIADLANTLGNLNDAITGVAGSIPGLEDGLLGIATSPMRNVADGLETLTNGSSSLTDRVRGLGQSITGAIPGPLGSWAGGLFDVADAESEAEEASRLQAEAARAEAEAATAAAEAAAEHEASLRSLSDATLASFNSTLALADAASRTDDAIAEYTVKTGEATAAGMGNAEANKAMRESMNDAEQAALAQAAAAVKLADDQAKANGEALTAYERNSLMANSLRTLAGSLDANDPLRSNLLAYATQLEQIPRDVNTQIDADTSEAERKLAALHQTVLGLLNAFKGIAPAASAAAPRSTAVTGPAPTTGVALTATAAPSVGLASAVVGPRGLAPAAVHNHINVTVSPLTNPAEVGRAVADALDAFYRRSGTRMRAVA